MSFFTANMGPFNAVSESSNLVPEVKTPAKKCSSTFVCLSVLTFVMTACLGCVIIVLLRVEVIFAVSEQQQAANDGVSLTTEPPLTTDLTSALVTVDRPADKLIDDAKDCTELEMTLNNIRLIESQVPLEVYHRFTDKYDQLNCNETNIDWPTTLRPLRIKRSATSECDMTRVGDGWCDSECNAPTYRYDGGDCCEHLCTYREALENKPWPCGSNGYDCKLPVPGETVPNWFTDSTQFCFRWYADGDGGQCGDGSEPHEICAHTSSKTRVYRDDTDGRSGGCQMGWAIKSPYSDPWFQQVQICFKFLADGGSPQQCNGVNQRNHEYVRCAEVGQYTPYYRDDTDGRGGGCRMSWKLNVPSNAEPWARRMQLCYEWYPDGDGGQCGGGAARKLCARAGFWTPFYRDDTDGRGGGCRMSWQLSVAN